jgi:hypothetical protein
MLRWPFLGSFGCLAWNAAASASKHASSAPAVTPANTCSSTRQQNGLSKGSERKQPQALVRSEVLLCLPDMCWRCFLQSRCACCTCVFYSDGWLLQMLLLCVQQSRDHKQYDPCFKLWLKHSAAAGMRLASFSTNCQQAWLLLLPLHAAAAAVALTASVPAFTAASAASLSMKPATAAGSATAPCSRSGSSVQ